MDEFDEDDEYLAPYYRCPEGCLMVTDGEMVFE